MIKIFFKIADKCTCCSDLKPIKLKIKNTRQVEEVNVTGIIVHWGVYSVTTYDDPLSAVRRKTQNGSEWYLMRLMVNEGDFRPVSGWQATQQYHKQLYGEDAGVDEYFNQLDTFNRESSRWDPQIWISSAKSIGADHIILTTRHHDGICLWPTKVTGARHTEQDLVRQFVDEVRASGLKVGFYYSWMEFNKGFTLDYLKNVVKPQIEELKQYKPDIWWFDGDWVIKSQTARKEISKMAKQLKKMP